MALLNEIYNFVVGRFISGVTGTQERALIANSTTVTNTYNLVEQLVSASGLTGLDWTTGQATATGLQGQWSVDANFRYDCIATNTWARVPISITTIEIYVGSIDDSGGIRTSAQLDTAFPTALQGQRATGLNGVYEKYPSSWRYTAQTIV